MSDKSKPKRSARKSASRDTPTAEQRRRTRRFWLLVVGVFALALLSLEMVDPTFFYEMMGDDPPRSGGDQSITNPNATLASFYTPEVLRWREDIRRWSREYQVNPNLIALVMQIESCGHPSVESFAGALGLMQVMPFHFENGDNMLNPDTNAARGISVFRECLFQFADRDVGIALACYNAGPSVTFRDPSTWPQETQSYYRWGTGLWDDAVNGRASSATLDEWLAAGGSRLCAQSAATEMPEPIARGYPVFYSRAGSPSGVG